VVFIRSVIFLGHLQQESHQSTVCFIKDLCGMNMTPAKTTWAGVGKMCFKIGGCKNSNAKLSLAIARHVPYFMIADCFDVRSSVLSY
jgi:hypothetical protein